MTANLARGLERAIPSSFITVGCLEATEGATVRAALQRPKLMRSWIAQRVRPRFNHVGRSERRIRHGTNGESTVAVVISTFVEAPLWMLRTSLQILLALLFDIAVLKYTRLNVAGEGVEKEKF